MSLPEFPTITPPLSREDAINQIISSIAMEELGLSHIINTEGEKLQYILGTIPGISGPGATIEDVLKVNESVRAVLQSTTESQTLLRSKLRQALDSGVLTGPTGPRGEAGPVTVAAKPEINITGPDGQASVNNIGDVKDVLLEFTLPRGPTGPTVTDVSMSVLNNIAGTTIPADAEGTPIPLPISSYMEGFSANIGATVFTIRDTGNYLVSYSIRTTETLTGSSSAVFLNNNEAITTKVSPAASDNFYNTSILALVGGTPLELRLSGTAEAHLQSGVGASLTAVRLT